MPPEWITFDAGALIACERGEKNMTALILRLSNEGIQIAIPAGALGQVWRAGGRQALLARLVKSKTVEVVPLDEATAKAAGILCGNRGTADVVDASVVICAQNKGNSPVVTSDPDDMMRLDPELHLIVA